MLPVSPRFLIDPTYRKLQSYRQFFGSEQVRGINRRPIVPRELWCGCHSAPSGLNAHLPGRRLLELSFLAQRIFLFAPILKCRQASASVERGELRPYLSATAS